MLFFNMTQQLLCGQEPCPACLPLTCKVQGARFASSWGQTMVVVAGVLVDDGSSRVSGGGGEERKEVWSDARGIAYEKKS